MNKNFLKTTIGALTIIASWIFGLYLGIWKFFIQPIMYACQCFDAGTLTGSIVGITILKCIFAGTIAGIVIYIGTSIGIKIGSQKRTK